MDQDLSLLRQQHKSACRLTRLINAAPETEPQLQKQLERELFGSFGEGAYCKPPLFCDYGATSSIGNRFFSNYGCVFQDRAGIRIGDHVMFGPSVVLLADSAPITVGSHVWIGGNSTVCGGVTIGSGTVIGAGSVVREDIPEGVFAAGNPCRILRPITEEDHFLWETKLEEYRTLCNAPMV